MRTLEEKTQEQYSRVIQKLTTIEHMLYFMFCMVIGFTLGIIVL